MPISHLKLYADAKFERNISDYCVLKPVSRFLSEIVIHNVNELLSDEVKQARPFSDSFCLYTFAAGEMMARWILDNPEAVKGKRVLDLGSGSGLVAIAAAMSGAAKVLALDQNPTAVRMIERNATANRVAVSAYFASHLDLHHFKNHFDVLTACDIFYIEPTSISKILIENARSGKTVYAGSAKEDAPLIRRYGRDLDFPQNFTPSGIYSGICAFQKLDKNTVQDYDKFQQDLSGLRIGNTRIDDSRSLVPLRP